MYLQVTTRNGIPSRQRGGFTFSPSPRVVQLDERDQRKPAHPDNVPRRKEVTKRLSELDAKLKKLSEASVEAMRHGMTLSPTDAAEQKTLMIRFERAMEELNSIDEDDRGAPSATGGGAARIEAIKEDDALMVRELTDAEAKKLIANEPEQDAERVPPDVAAELAAMRARMAEMEAELLELKTAPGAETSDSTDKARGEGADRAGRERLGKKQ